MPEEPKEKSEVKQHLFRVTAEEDKLLLGLVELAYHLQLIPEATIQKFVMFSINCARTVVKEQYRHRKAK